MNMRPRPREEPELNLISLIDIVLLLLIFFMVSTTFVTEARMKIQLPEAGVEPSASRAKTEPLEISVTAEGAYRVNGKTLINSGAPTLYAAVRAAAGDNRSMPVTIRADGRAAHQSVVTAMDVVGRLGFKSIGIATVNQATTPGQGKKSE
jgi:biopolymer transport protein ExbD